MIIYTFFGPWFYEKLKFFILLVIIMCNKGRDLSVQYFYFCKIYINNQIMVFIFKKT